MQTPPQKYYHIDQEQWTSFVNSRLCEGWEEFSRVQRDRRLKCVYNHHISCKGYANLTNELDELAAACQGQDILTEALSKQNIKDV
ncbi:unnamed protein product [Citrullus colocynthis]|uniref:Uncharacterized protein n=1 Tax=Citrullus colocynthis TaxID=252529 RepID=A0ABP0YU00_9ROSI